MSYEEYDSKKGGSAVPDLYSDYHGGNAGEMYTNGEESKSACATFVEQVGELRWRVLAIACFLTFGSYFIFDFPGSIGMGNENTIEAYFKANNKEYNYQMNQLLYSVYSWPNTVLSIFGGLLIDKVLGLRRAMFLFTFLILVGSLMFWLGVQLVNFPLMVAARVVFGLGGESLSVSQSAFVARWFKGKPGMALAFGITISFSRVGSSCNFLLSPTIAQRYGVELATLLGTFACCVSLAACLLLIVADIYAVRTGYIKPEARDSDTEEVMRFSDILKLPREFWAICGICVFCYSAIFPFIGISKTFFHVKYGYTEVMASAYISLYQFTSAAGSPIVSAIVDGVGRNTIWLIMASSCFILTHLAFMFTMIPGPVMVAAMGIFYSFLVAGLWPSVPYTVDDNIVGFAYGVMTAIQNVGLASFPIAIGKVLVHFSDSKEAADSMSPSLSPSISPSMSWTESDSWVVETTILGYNMTILVFIGCAGLSLLFSIALLLLDLRREGILTSSSSERKRILQNRESQALLNAGNTQSLVNDDGI